MAGAEAGPVVAVEIFVEQDEVFPVRIGPEDLEPSVHGAPAVGSGEEDADQAAREVGGDVPQGHEAPGPGGVLDLELAPEEGVEALERLDDEEVHGKPDGPPPVRVAAEQPGA